jgi:hypothetical protein
MPQLAADPGEETLALFAQTVWKMSRRPNGKAILRFLERISEAARRRGSVELLTRYTEMILGFMERTTGSIHGFHTTIPRPSLPDRLKRIPWLLNQRTCHGVRNWVDCGLRHYADHPDRQRVGLPEQDRPGGAAAGAAPAAVHGTDQVSPPRGDNHFLMVGIRNC